MKKKGKAAIGVLVGSFLAKKASHGSGNSITEGEIAPALVIFFVLAGIVIIGAIVAACVAVCLQNLRAKKDVTSEEPSKITSLP